MRFTLFALYNNIGGSIVCCCGWTKSKSCSAYTGPAIGTPCITSNFLHNNVKLWYLALPGGVSDSSVYNTDLWEVTGADKEILTVGSKMGGGRCKGNQEDHWQTFHGSGYLEQLEHSVPFYRLIFFCGWGYPGIYVYAWDLGNRGRMRYIVSETN